MKKVNLNNLYESSIPPVDIKSLWVDKDESTGDIIAIHRFNIATHAWEPYLVSVDYMKPEDTNTESGGIEPTPDDVEIVPPAPIPTPEPEVPVIPGDI